MAQYIIWTSKCAAKGKTIQEVSVPWKCQGNGTKCRSSFIIAGRGQILTALSSSVQKSVDHASSCQLLKTWIDSPLQAFPGTCGSDNFQKQKGKSLQKGEESKEREMIAYGKQNVLHTFQHATFIGPLFEQISCKLRCLQIGGDQGKRLPQQTCS